MSTDPEKDLEEKATTETEKILERAIHRMVDRWLDEKFKQFGKWAIISLLALLFYAGIKIILHYQGYHQAP